MKAKKKMSMYNKGGKTNPSKRKAPALSPTGRLLDDPRPQEEEKDIPYFLRKDYVEGGRKSGIASDAKSPYEKARDKRSMNYDRLAERAEINANEAFYKGKMSKEDVQKVKKAVEEYKADKPNAMRESGYGRTPEEKKAQDRAIRRMKNSKAKGGMKVKKYQEGGMNATGETRRGLRPKNPLSQEEIAKLDRQKRSKAARRRQNMMSYSSAGEMVIDSPFHSASQSQAKIDFRQKKELAKMGVEDLTEFFESEMYKGKGPKPSKEQIEKFVAKYSK